MKKKKTSLETLRVTKNKKKFKTAMMSSDSRENSYSKSSMAEIIPTK